MAPDADADAGTFLSRWSRRKVQVQRGEAVPAQPPPAASEAAVTAAPVPQATAAAVPDTDAPQAAAQSVPPPPTLAEAQRLTPADDFSRFVARDVDPQVRNTALKTLFSDPHFNVMDGLDTYIDDYNKADPLPPGMLRQMAQAASLGLFDDEPETPATASTAPALPPAPPALNPPAAPPDTPDTPPDEDTDLRLQPHDDAGHAGHQPGAAQDPGRQP